MTTDNLATLKSFAESLTTDRLTIENFAYGMGDRRIERYCAFNSTFKVVAHWDPIKSRPVRGPVPFKSYCS